MIKMLCKYVAISEIPDLNSKEEYKEIVSPLDYRFCFKKGELYDVLGVTQISGILNFYLVAEGSYELDFGPAVLFECDWNKIPENWYVRMSSFNGDNFEILPEKLSLIDRWFEKYIDEDPDILDLVKKVVIDMRYPNARIASPELLLEVIETCEKYREKELSGEEFHKHIYRIEQVLISLEDKELREFFTSMENEIHNIRLINDGLDFSNNPSFAAEILFLVQKIEEECKKWLGIEWLNSNSMCDKV